MNYSGTGTTIKRAAGRPAEHAGGAARCLSEAVGETASAEPDFPEVLTAA